MPDGPARARELDAARRRLDSVGRRLERGEEPDQDVDHEAEARGKRGCDQHGAHDVRPHAEVMADAAGHARNPAVAAAALEAGSPFAGVDLGHAGMFPYALGRPRWGTTPRTRGGTQGPIGDFPNGSSASSRPIIGA